MAPVSGCAQVPPLGLKSIESFRADPKYGGDGKRADLAYAVYALSRGQTEIDVEAAIRSRDLSHKGNERRQQDYVERTIKKALATYGTRSPAVKKGALYGKEHNRCGERRSGAGRGRARKRHRRASRVIPFI